MPRPGLGDDFVAWAATVDDQTWRSVRIRVENLRMQRRHTRHQ